MYCTHLEASSQFFASIPQFEPNHNEDVPILRFDPEESILLVVDVQPSFMGGIFEADRVLKRASFLSQVAQILGVPVFATEQNVARMGSTDPLLKSSVGTTYPKMAFSCFWCTELMDQLASLDRRQVILVGIETHICVAQTALDLMVAGLDVGVCPDAVSSRTPERHKLGMERIRDAGATPIHSEAVAYEWMKTAEHPNFRDVLGLVKEFSW